jgi:hypothetical protein
MSTTRALMAVARAYVTKRDLAQDRAVAAALAVWFGAPPTDATQLPESLISLLTGLGVGESAAIEVGALAATAPVLGRGPDGSPAWLRRQPAVERVAADEPMHRARYVLAAARRDSPREQQYFAAHVAAAVNRRDAARRIDGMGNQVLRWTTVGDDRVHPDCRRLEGRLFTATNLPDGLVPGGVRVGCRCRAVPWGRPFWAISEF